MQLRVRHLQTTCAAAVVTIDVHGPLDRVKDVSFGVRDERIAKCPRMVGDEPTTFPSSASREHPLSSVRLLL